MDIRIKFEKLNLTFDLSFLNNDLEADQGLESSVIVSLFSDARAEENQLPPGQKEKKGWWGDAIDPTNQDSTGSLLWLLEREKQTEETLDRAEQYTRAALQWLLDDGIASSVDVATSYPADSVLLIEVTIARVGKSIVSYRYNLIWEGQANHAI